MLIYTVDCALAVDESAVLARFAGDPHVRVSPDTNYRFVGQAADGFFEGASARQRPVVVGFGPCGIFAALILAQMGLRPIVLERGKEVRERTKDTWGLWRQGRLDPESNVQFGEGGAGTFSDGKLWSQISDPRHLTRKVLAEFVKAGAPDEILYVAKPHIGTFRLVGMVEKMRADIVALGGEIRFEQRVVDVLIEGRGDAARCAASRWPPARSCAPTTWCWRWATARATPSRCCTSAACAWTPSRFPSATASSTRKASSTARASAPTRATSCWARPTTSWCTTPATAARSTASACARAARWWPPRRRPTAWSPTA